MANAYQLMRLTTADSTVSFVGRTNLQAGLGPRPGIIGIINYLRGIIGGQWGGQLEVTTGTVFATGALTSTGAATAAETFSLANVIFTARDSGATGNEFNVSSNVTTQATNIKNAINGSTNLAGIVTATSLAGVVTISAVNPGTSGNGIQLSESLTNVSATAFSGGTNGTTYTMNLL